MRRRHEPVRHPDHQNGLFRRDVRWRVLRRSTRSTPASSSIPRSIPSTTRSIGTRGRRRAIPAGKLMTVPMNPNIPLLYYRADLYAEGLKVPDTWDELLANAKALHSPPKRYGIVQRGARGAFDVTYDFLPYLWATAASIFNDQKAGDYTDHHQQPGGASRRSTTNPAGQGGGPPQDRRPAPGGGHPEHRHRQGRAGHPGDRRLVADGRPGQVGRRRQDRLRRAAARRRPPTAPRSATGSAASRGTCLRSGSRRRSRSCAGSRPAKRRWPTPRPARRRCAATCSRPISRSSPDSAGWAPGRRGSGSRRQNFSIPEAPEIVAITELEPQPGRSPAKWARRGPEPHGRRDRRRHGPRPATRRRGCPRCPEARGGGREASARRQCPPGHGGRGASARPVLAPATLAPALLVCCCC